MFVSRCDLVFNFSKIAFVYFNRMHEDAFVLNLVQIGRETAEESWLEKKINNIKAKPTEKHNITEI